MNQASIGIPSSIAGLCRWVRVATQVFGGVERDRL
jgi:hypothetical protein